MHVRQTQHPESQQRNDGDSNHQALHHAGEPHANQIDTGADPNQRDRASDRGQARQGMEISPKPQGHVSTDEDVRSPVPPAHQEAPVGAKQRPREGVSTTCQRIAAGKFSIGQCNQQGHAKSQQKGQQCSRPCPSRRCPDQHKDPAANRATHTECNRLTQRQHPAESM